MKLAFNAVALLSPKTGVGQYVLNLAQALTEAAQVQPDFFYGTHWSRQLITSVPDGVAGMMSWFRKHLPGAYALRQAVQKNRFMHRTRHGSFDLYHEPNNIALPFDGPTVLTVHDLSWIRYPEMHPRERVQAMNKYFESSLRGVSRILTDSVFVKEELIAVFGVARDRIHPVHLGAESVFRPLQAQQTALVLQSLGLIHGQYWLAVGTLEPRKNLQLALQAFMQLPKSIRQSCPLVVAGMKGWHTGPLEQQLAPLRAAGEVRLLGYLNRQDLAVTLAGAKALIYPSIYEGFGLPPLEAMACGVPVITSDRSSLPEVVGNAGLLVDPEDVDGLARHMRPARQGWPAAQPGLFMAPVCPGNP
jgi:glycosyltransferase involved in cell wall biosynthesis